jgi:hypothetical protein
LHERALTGGLDAELLVDARHHPSSPGSRDPCRCFQSNGNMPGVNRVNGNATAGGRSTSGGSSGAGPSHATHRTTDRATRSIVIMSTGSAWTITAPHRPHFIDIAARRQVRLIAANSAGWRGP